MSLPHDDDEFENFMERVEEASKIISKLKDGEIKPEEVDSKEELLRKKKEQAERERIEKKKREEERILHAQEEQARQKWGFAYGYCPRCRSEPKNLELPLETKKKILKKQLAPPPEEGEKNKIKIEEITDEATAAAPAAPQPDDGDVAVLPACPICSTQLLNVEQRRSQLFERVGELKDERRRKAEARDRWKRWLSTQQYHRVGSGLTDYSKWDVFEPSDDEEDALPPPPPPDTPEFKAMEKDIDDRHKIRVERTREATKLKEEGNELMKSGKYEQAVEKYTLALEKEKSLKSIYTNRALAYNKLKMFKEAETDCSKVLDIAEFLDNNTGPGVKDARIKALMRRSAARNGLKLFKEAVEDLEVALTLDPKSKEITELLATTKESLRQANVAQKISKSIAPAAEAVPAADASATSPPSAQKDDSAVAAATAEEAIEEPTLEKKKKKDTMPPPAADEEKEQEKKKEPKEEPFVDFDPETKDAMQKVGDLLSQLDSSRKNIAKSLVGKKTDTTTANESPSVESIEEQGDEEVKLHSVLTAIKKYIEGKDEMRILVREKSGINNLCELLLCAKYEAFPDRLVTAAADCLSTSCEDNAVSSSAVFSYRGGVCFTGILSLATTIIPPATPTRGEDTFLAATKLLEELMRTESLRREVGVKFPTLFAQLSAALSASNASVPSSRKNILLAVFANIVFHDEGRAALKTFLVSEDAQKSSGEGAAAAAEGNGGNDFLSLLFVFLVGVDKIRKTQAARSLMNLACDKTLRFYLAQADLEKKSSPFALCVVAEMQKWGSSDGSGEDNEVLENVVGAMINLALDAKMADRFVASSDLLVCLAKILSSLSGPQLLAERTASLVARCISASSNSVNAAEVVIAKNILKSACLRATAASDKSELARKIQSQCIRVISTCCHHKPDQSVPVVVSTPNIWPVVTSFLSTDSNSDDIAGNACIIVIKCADNAPETRVEIGKLGGVEKLLSICRSKRGGVQSNAAFALARIVKHEPNLIKLRELHGIEILATCLGK